jgi:hypothetical protein
LYYKTYELHKLIRPVQNSKKYEIRIMIGILGIALTSMLLMNSGIVTTARAQGTSPIPSNISSQEQGNSTLHSSDNATDVVRDSQLVLLEGKSIPAKGFIHLYDTTPYMIMNGHVAAVIPCDANSKPVANILIGQAPNLKPAELENIKELSTPGKSCLYHVDLESNPGGQAGLITDIAIQNPTNTEMKFPAASTIVIGVNEIEQGAEKGGMGNMTG